MVEGLDRVAEKVGDAGIRRDLRPGLQFGAAVGLKRFAVREPATDTHSLHNHAQVLLSRKIVCADGRRCERVRGTKRDFAATLGRDKRGTETETVILAGIESMIHVVGGAENQLQIGNFESRACVQKNSSFGDVGDQRAALEAKIAQQVRQRLRACKTYRLCAQITY